jgi:hypothetical protein
VAWLLLLLLPQVGVVLTPESCDNVLVSLHGIAISIDNASKVNLKIDRVHIGDATQHMEPGDSILLRAPCDKNLSEALSKQTSMKAQVCVSIIMQPPHSDHGKLGFLLLLVASLPRCLVILRCPVSSSQERIPFLDLTFKPSELLAEAQGPAVADPEEAEGVKRQTEFQSVPRDNIDIKVSGIETAMAQDVVVRILKFGQDFNRAQEAGLINNTDLTGATTQRS